MYKVEIRYDAVNDSFILKENSNCIELYRESVKGLYYMTKVLDKIDEFLSSQKEYTDSELSKAVLCVCEFDFEEVKEEMLNAIVCCKYSSEEEAMKSIWDELILTPFYGKKEDE